MGCLLQFLLSLGQIGGGRHLPELPMELLQVVVLADGAQANASSYRELLQVFDAAYNPLIAL
ncbi:hypothetical protein D3C73_1635210 [compost metagenome]